MAPAFFLEQKTAVKMHAFQSARARKASGYDTANDNGNVIEEIRP
jgi:hypothetical protein